MLPERTAQRGFHVEREGMVAGGAALLITVLNEVRGKSMASHRSPSYS
jgi:hypothetical protein